jgi:hypothetical protein
MQINSFPGFFLVLHPCLALVTLFFLPSNTQPLQFNSRSPPPILVSSSHPYPSYAIPRSLLILILTSPSRVCSSSIPNIPPTVLPIVAPPTFLRLPLLPTPHRPCGSDWRGYDACSARHYSSLWLVACLLFARTGFSSLFFSFPNAYCVLGGCCVFKFSASLVLVE